MEKSKHHNKSPINSCQRKYLDYLIILLRVCGMWEWFPSNPSVPLKAFDFAYFAMIAFFIIHIAVFSLCDLFQSWVTVSDATVNLINTIIYTMGTGILIYFKIYKLELYALVERLESGFRFHSARGLTNLTMTQSFLLARFICLSYATTCLVSCCHWTAVPLLADGDIKSLPIQLWYPVDVQVSPNYEIAYVLQFFAQLVIGVLFANLCMFVVTICILICGQLDLLCCSVRNVRFTAALRLGVTHARLMRELDYQHFQDDEQHQYFASTSEMVDSIYHFDDKVDIKKTAKSKLKSVKFDIYCPTYDSETERALIECVQFHHAILEYLRVFRHFSSPILFMKILEITILTCVVMYAMSAKMEVKIIEYLALCITDIFFYCYFGNQVMLQSWKLCEAILQSMWHTGSRACRRMLTFMLLANTKPNIVHAGMFFKLNIDTFIMVLKTSFSYYMVLRNVNAN